MKKKRYRRKTTFKKKKNKVLSGFAGVISRPTGSIRICRVVAPASLLTNLNRFSYWVPDRPVKTETKPSQTGLNRAKPRQNRAKPVWTGFCPKKPKPVGLTRFQFFFKKISVWLLFFIKTEPNRKWSPIVNSI